jgi:hypothetical protein
MALRYPRRQVNLTSDQINIYGHRLKEAFSMKPETTIQEALQKTIKLAGNPKEAYQQVADVAVTALGALRELSNGSLPALYYLGTDGKLYVMDTCCLTIESPRERHLALGLLQYAQEMIEEGWDEPEEPEELDDEESIERQYKDAWAVVGETLTHGQIETHPHYDDQFHWLSASGKMFKARVDDRNVRLVEPIRAFVYNSSSQTTGWVEGEYFCWSDKNGEKLGTLDWEPVSDYPLGEGTKESPMVFWPPSPDNPNTHKAHLIGLDKWVRGRYLKKADSFAWEDNKGDIAVTTSGGFDSVTKL